MTKFPEAGGTLNWASNFMFYANSYKSSWECLPPLKHLINGPNFPKAFQLQVSHGVFPLKCSSASASLAGSPPWYLFTVTEERIMGFSKWIRAAAIRWQF